MSYYSGSWGGSYSYSSYGGCTWGSYSYKSSYSWSSYNCTSSYSWRDYSYKSSCDWGSYSYKCDDYSWDKYGSCYDKDDSCSWYDKCDWDYKCDWDKYCDKDEDPDPVADEACVCSDESVTIDVLANDNDPDGDGLTITAINGQAVAEGDMVTLGSGATVTLSGGQLVYDLSGADDFDGLLINETDADQFTYTVMDGNGDEASATVDIEVHGALNTLATIEASLPAGVIQYTVTDHGSPEAFSLTINFSDDDRLNGLTFTEAYCLDEEGALNDGTLLEGNIFLADAGSIPTGALDQAAPLIVGNAVVSDFGATARDNIDLVNWILNQDFGSMDNGDSPAEEFYTDAEIQGAIWGLMNGVITIAQGNGTGANALEIFNAAVESTESEGFEAGAGDIVGLFIQPTEATQTDLNHVQPFLIGIPFDDLGQDCDCLCY